MLFFSYVMLDIKFIREKPKEVKASLKKRGLETRDVDLLLELDKKWKTLKQDVDALRAERNKISEKINEAKKQGKKIDDIIKRAREIPIKIAEEEKELMSTEEKREALMEKLPNLVDKSVPVGSSEKNIDGILQNSKGTYICYTKCRICRQNLNHEIKKPHFDNSSQNCAMEGDSGCHRSDAGFFEKEAKIGILDCGDRAL